jgi:hypothetical protein
MLVAQVDWKSKVVIQANFVEIISERFVRNDGIAYEWKDWERARVACSSRKSCK